MERTPYCLELGVALSDIENFKRELAARLCVCVCEMLHAVQESHSVVFSSTELPLSFRDVSFSPFKKFPCFTQTRVVTVCFGN